MGRSLETDDSHDALRNNVRFKIHQETTPFMAMHDDLLTSIQTRSDFIAMNSASSVWAWMTQQQEARHEYKDH